jgi:hypothetical protein
MASVLSHAQLNAQLAQGTVAPLYAVVGEEATGCGSGCAEDRPVRGRRE